ncbi:MAG TPA: efflux RND transporter periplasmic adaptor subunit [Gemmatimonadales bacterium]|nr:efflux RND transporter periplasmic adaptor subunit [Gemmatimonadales bacterium]
MRPRLLVTLLATVPAALACHKAVPAPVYQAVPVERRDIVVSALASGVIEPDTVVEVRSRASGEVIKLSAETGQTVQRGAPLVQIDPRLPRNSYDQAKADLDVAKAQLDNARVERDRTNQLLKEQSATVQESEQAQLAFANAQANLVKAQIEVDNAKILLEDTDVRAPITGTIIEKSIERGQQIASATSNVGGGTVLMRMADLRLVQAVTLVDETDIGKIRSGMRATVTVNAYPNQPFEGEVLKVEPNDTTSQNVTMFPVRVRVQNINNELLPGMNCDVRIHVGRADSVLAVPNAALRTQKDVASAAQVLGLPPDQVHAELASSRPAAGAAGGARGDSTGAAGRGATAPGARGRGARARGASGGVASGDSARGGAGYVYSGQYIVFVKHGGAPVPRTIRTGLTDLDYSQVLSGLSPGDSVLLLPSASLVRSQQDFKDRVNRVTGGGAVPGMQQQPGRPPQSPQARSQATPPGQSH